MLGERVHMEPLHRLTAVPLPVQGRSISQAVLFLQ